MNPLQAYRQQKAITQSAVEQAIELQRQNAWKYIYPETGPLRRELYKVHQAALEAGATTLARYILGGNRVGKTRGIGAFETAQHATGVYRSWWQGYRIPTDVGPPELWISGKSNEWLRDNAWKELLGPPEAIGTGMLPAESIVHIERESNPVGSVGRVWVRHKSGGKAVIGSKTWNQGRDAYAGTFRPFIWLDEEHPKQVVDECLLRLTSTVPGRPNGRLLCTLTPLDGITEFVQPLVSEPDTQHRRVFYITWDDVPHLTPEIKAILMDGMSEINKNSRTRGIPEFGEGQIYPYSEALYLVDPFELPSHWPRCYGFDPRWGRTGGVWAAIDRDSDIVYIYSDYMRENAEVSIHIDAIKNRGEWIPGAFDFAGANIDDGEKLFDQYSRELKNVVRAQKTLFAGISEVQRRFASGRLKVFRNCTHLRKEMPLYRIQNGKVVATMNDVLDALRYLIMSGLSIAVVEPYRTKLHDPLESLRSYHRGSGSWMA